MKKMNWVFNIPNTNGSIMTKAEMVKESRDVLTSCLVSGLKSVNQSGGDMEQILLLIIVKDKIKKVKDGEKLLLDSEEFRLFESASKGRFNYDAAELVAQFDTMIKEAKEIEVEEIKEK